MLVDLVDYFLLGIIINVLFCCEFRVDAASNTTDCHIGVHQRKNYYSFSHFFRFRYWSYLSNTKNHRIYFR